MRLRHKEPPEGARLLLRAVLRPGPPDPKLLSPALALLHVQTDLCGTFLGGVYSPESPRLGVGV